MEIKWKKGTNDSQRVLFANVPVSKFSDVFRREGDAGGDDFGGVNAL